MLRKTLRGILFACLFIIPFVPLFVSAQFFFPFITTKAFVWRIIVEVLLAAWLVYIALEPSYRPRRSLVSICAGAFLLIVIAADGFGVAPVKSFWSNFERMEGLVTMLHLAALFLVMSTFLKEREWKWWWNTSLVGSLFVSGYSLLQLAGSLPIHQGGVRVDATFGNAAYLAVYLLIHIFLAAFLALRSKEKWVRYLYGVLIIIELFVLYETATRGAILGLLGGLFVVAALNIRNKGSNLARKTSRGIFVGLAVIILGFFAIRHTSFAQNSEVLSRFTTLSLSEWKTEGRAFIWPMALKGIAERPLLGWGQDNFNYIFQQYYSPQMFALEPWFDRAHNIFLDWGVSAGLLGLLGYLSLYVALLYLLWKKNPTMSHLDKSVLTGLIAAYFFNNLFVFDNLISYILFAALLAYVHHHSTNAGHPHKSPSVRANQFALYTAVPVFIALVFAVYYLNVKPIEANVNLIHALQAVQVQGADPATAQGFFDAAYNDSRLGRPEIVEWYISSAGQVLSSSISDSAKESYYNSVRAKAVAQAADLAQDARYQILAGTLFTETAADAESRTLAENYLKKAEKLMPGKQAIYFEEGNLYLSEGKTAESMAVLKKAYDMAPDYTEAGIVYLTAAIYTHDTAVERALIQKLPTSNLVNDSRISSALFQTGQYGDLIALLQQRLTLASTTPQNYVDLAFAYSKAGQNQNAITVLNLLAQRFPSYRDQVDATIKQFQTTPTK